MAERGARVVLLAVRWGDPHSESAFVARALTGAISRHAEVVVATPGNPRDSGPDGAFDVHRIGGEPGVWPSVARWPERLTGASIAIVVGGGAGVLLARALLPGAEVVEVAGPGAPTAARVWALTPDRAAELDPQRTDHVGIAVPMNPLAARDRHNGFGFVDYLLVLSDRRESGGDPRFAPTPPAAWLAAGLPQFDLVVVEDGIATAFRSRSWRGEVAIDTRTDLHRLLAHARACVDLGPGGLIGRECIESMLLGTPILVPCSSPARHYVADGGLCFSDPAELLAAAKSFGHIALCEQLGSQAQERAISRFGDSPSFVRRVGEALKALLETS